MRTFFDSSSFAKRYIREAGSEEVDNACMEASELGLSIICMPEVVSALSRRLREKDITKTQYERATHRLGLEIRDADIVNLTTSLVGRTIKLLETNVLRTMDALQIACALEWGAELFVSSDKRQIAAAKKSGLTSLFTGGK